MLHDKIVTGTGDWIMGGGLLPEGYALCFWQGAHSPDGVQQVMQPVRNPDFYISFNSREGINAAIETLNLLGQAYDANIGNVGAIAGDLQESNKG